MQNDESATVKPCSGFATRVTAIGFQILPCSRHRRCSRAWS